MKLQSQEYEPAIDGLRAVAIVSVLGFHFSPYRFPGGYVGVDVFFVISGFLITRIILDQMNTGTFSFWEFYRRRFYRILPALTATVLLTIVLGVLFFTPGDLSSLGASGVASLLMFPNVFFWGQSGYFDVAATQKPLLHFWSLGVEEQFYWLWPLMLLVAWRWRGIPGTAWLLLATSILSLAAAEFVLDVDSAAAFYLTPFRMVEFAIGAACLWLPKFRRASPGGSVVLILGLSMIAATTVLFDENTRFPGLTSLVPCLGTALAITATRTSVASVVLGNPVALGLGRISYSLYLLHWPLLVFAGYWKVGPLARDEKIFLLAISIGAAWLMYRYVERPFRARISKVTTTGRRKRFTVLTSTIIAGLTIGIYAFQSEGMPWRIDEDRLTKTSEMPMPGCRLVREVSTFERICEIPGDQAGALRALVIGDSHADQLVPALSYLSREIGIEFRVWTHWGCPPIWGTYKTRTDDPVREHSCAEAVRNWETYVKDHEYDLVVLAARWMWLFEPDRYGEMVLRRDFLVDTSNPVYDTAASRRLFVERLDSTVDSIVASGARVVVFSQVPLLSKTVRDCDNVPSWLYTAGHLRERCDPGVTYDEQIERLKFTNRTIRSLADPCVLPILPSDYLCDPQKRACRYRRDKRIMYSDTDHLSIDGSLWLAAEIRTMTVDWLIESTETCGHGQRTPSNPGVKVTRHNLDVVTSVPMSSGKLD